MIFHIAVCSPDPVLRGRVQRHCMEYYARRADACIVEQLESTAALLQQEEAGSRYELYLIELPAANPCSGLQAAAELRRRGVRAPLAFLAHTTAYAYEAFRVDAMQYLHIPFRPEQLTALLDRATEPEYGPVIPVVTAMGLRALPFADIEYLECTHHVVHYHLASGEDVASLSLRVPFSEVAKPLLADARFLQPHRSYVVNLAAAAQLHVFHLSGGGLLHARRLGGLLDLGHIEGALIAHHQAHPLILQLADLLLQIADGSGDRRQLDVTHDQHHRHGCQRTHGTQDQGGHPLPGTGRRPVTGRLLGLGLPLRAGCLLQLPLAGQCIQIVGQIPIYHCVGSSLLLCHDGSSFPYPLYGQGDRPPFSRL